MNISQVRVSFLGFGEAGFRLAKDLKRAGLKEIAIYDKFWDMSLYKKVIQCRATDAKVTPLPNVQELAALSEFVFSTVTVASSKEIAKETAAFLRANQIYVDTKLSSPQSKTAAAQPIMAEATKAKLEWVAGLGLAEHFNFQIPRSYTNVITARKKSYKI